MSQRSSTHGKRSFDYPVKTRGSKIAKAIRREANSLSASEREALFKEGMQIVYGGPGTRKTLTVQLPDSVMKAIEDLAAREGFSVSQFLASAASEKLAVMLTKDYPHREAAAGRWEDFEKYLASVPDVPAQRGDQL